MTKTCGGCAACCETVPVKELGLGSFTRCPHQRPPFDISGPGCGIYADRPYSCRSWSCAWLEADWADEYRPDRCGLVIDPNYDLIRVNEREVRACQIWAMPGHEADYDRPEILDLLMSLITGAQCVVIWRTKDGMGTVFLLDPKTGALSRSAPVLPTPNADAILGTAVERIYRANFTN
jgi:hypothetical protein